MLWILLFCSVSLFFWSYTRLDLLVVSDRIFGGIAARVFSIGQMPFSSVKSLREVYTVNMMWECWLLYQLMCLQCIMRCSQNVKKITECHKNSLLREVTRFYTLIHGCPPSVIGPSLLLLPVLGTVVITCHVRSPYVCFLRSPQGFPLHAFLPMTFTDTFVVPAQW